MSAKILYPILIYISLIAVTASVVDADVLNVPGDYDTIADAVEFVDGGDTILVAPGVYDEDLIEIMPHLMENPDGITLQGAGRSLTTIVGDVRVDIDFISQDTETPFKIDGFRIEGNISVDANFVIISNNFVTSRVNREGTVVGRISVGYGSGNITVVDNIIKDAISGGLFLAGNDDVVELKADVLIARNVIEGSEQGLSCRSTAPEIRENRIVGNERGVFIFGKSAKPDLGTGESPGRNAIYGNGEYDIKNASNDIISAEHNYWGHPDGPEAGETAIIINDGNGQVDYEPWLAGDEAARYSVQPRKKLLSSWGQIKRGR